MHLGYFGRPESKGAIQERDLQAFRRRRRKFLAECSFRRPSTLHQRVELKSSAWPYSRLEKKSSTSRARRRNACGFVLYWITLQLSDEDPQLCALTASSESMNSTCTDERSLCTPWGEHWAFTASSLTDVSLGRHPPSSSPSSGSYLFL